MAPVARHQRILRDAAELNAHAMAEPAPVSYVIAFTTTHLEVQFSAWCRTASFADLRAMQSSARSTVACASPTREAISAERARSQ